MISKLTCAYELQLTNAAAAPVGYDSKLTCAYELQHFLTLPSPRDISLETYLRIRIATGLQFRKPLICISKLTCAYELQHILAKFNSKDKHSKLTCAYELQLRLWELFS